MWMIKLYTLLGVLTTGEIGSGDPLLVIRNINKVYLVSLEDGPLSLGEFDSVLTIISLGLFYGDT